MPGCFFVSVASAALTSSGQLFCASTVSQTVSSLASAPVLSEPPLPLSPHAATETIMPAIPIAAISLRFTPTSSGSWTNGVDQ